MIFACSFMLDLSALRRIFRGPSCQEDHEKVADGSRRSAGLSAMGRVDNRQRGCGFRNYSESMVDRLGRSLVLLAVVGWMGAGGRTFGLAQGQTAVGGQAAEESKVVEAERPLPDIPALMRSVETNQRMSEAIEKDYLYRSVQTEEQMDGHGRVKKTEVREYDVFWVNGVPVHRLTKKDGKELSAGDQKKESEKIDKEVAQATEKRAKSDKEGKETDPRGNDEVTVSRLLELGRFTNARRVSLDGRDTIDVDYAGDPKAKTKNRLEAAIRDMVGTAWVDEQDRMLVKAEGHFVNDFKIGGGLLADIKKGTSFAMEQHKVNDEVWLPAVFEGQGAARAMLVFNFNGRVRAVESEYRKFKATSTIVPVTNPGQSPPQ